MAKYTDQSSHILLQTSETNAARFDGGGWFLQYETINDAPEVLRLMLKTGNETLLTCPRRLPRKVNGGTLVFINQIRIAGFIRNLAVRR
jgi:hypothetical protein